MRVLLLTVLVAFSALPVAAQDVPPPRPRPDATTGETGAAPLPQSRPADTPSASDDLPPVPDSDEPVEEPPPRVFQSACPAVLSGRVTATALPPIDESACGARSPLRVTAVAVGGRSVELSSPATLSCEMATSLADWIAAVDALAVAREDAHVDTLIVGTSYMCRSVNHAEGGRLSEHAFANALDVVGFGLADGQRFDVLTGWGASDEQGAHLLRFAHDAACGRFTTTLGPESNGLHRDHFHIDMGCHGQSCTAQLCE